MTGQTYLNFKTGVSLFKICRVGVRATTIWVYNLLVKEYKQASSWV